MHDYPMLHDQRQWDALCCVRGQNKGTFVEGAPHYTGGSLGLLPASVAESRISKSNSSAHAPTVFVTTHRRMVRYLVITPSYNPTVFVTTHRRMVTLTLTLTLTLALALTPSVALPSDHP